MRQFAPARRKRPRRPRRPAAPPAPAPLAPAPLPADTPAWTVGGRPQLGVYGLLAAPERQREMARHELAHALQQRLLPRDESTTARQWAESEATSYSRGGRLDLSTARGVPSVLGLPPLEMTPFDRIFVGNAGVVAEAYEAGVSVRVFRTYEQLGLERLNPYVGDTRSETHYHYFACKRPRPAGFAALAKRMRAIALDTAAMNVKIPVDSPSRVALVAVFGDAAEAAFRTAGGRGLVVLPESDLFKNRSKLNLRRPRFAAATVAHEAAHAIFEHHQVAGDPDPARRVPDAFAVQLAELFVRLGRTRRVDGPMGKFNPRKPPSTAETRGGPPAGRIMVSDTLWSGSGGHPNVVEEFFASAYAGFVLEPKLFRRIVRHYAKGVGGDLPGLAQELFELLARVGDPAALSKLPGARPGDAAAAALDRSGEPIDFSGKIGTLGALIDPTSLPAPSRVTCS